MASLRLGLSMPLHPLSDVSPGDWFIADHAPLVLRENLGPSGFEAYARILHSEMNSGDADRYEGHLVEPLLDALRDVLRAHTTTPDHCYFALWDGYGDIYGGDSAGFLVAFSGPMRWPGRVFTKAKPPPPPPPAFSRGVMDGPRLTANHADHFLFRGPLNEAGQWGATPLGDGIPRDINSPNLMWPADHAWFVTTNIDSTWTGVGGSAALIDDLLHDWRLEVVRNRYDENALR